MDSLTLKSNFSKKAVSKIVSKFISKKLDSPVEINIEDLTLVHDEDGKIKLDVKAVGIADESIIKKLT